MQTECRNRRRQYGAQYRQASSPNWMSRFKGTEDCVLQISATGECSPHTPTSLLPLWEKVARIEDARRMRGLSPHGQTSNQRDAFAETDPSPRAFGATLSHKGRGCINITHPSPA